MLCHPERSPYSDEVEGSTPRFRKLCNLRQLMMTQCRSFGFAQDGKKEYFFANIDFFPILRENS